MNWRPNIPPPCPNMPHSWAMFGRLTTLTILQISKTIFMTCICDLVHLKQTYQWSFLPKKNILLHRIFHLRAKNWNLSQHTPLSPKRGTLLLLVQTETDMSLLCQYNLSASDPIILDVLCLPNMDALWLLWTRVYTLFTLRFLRKQEQCIYGEIGRENIVAWQRIN